jgi:hypothetical protein
MKNTSVWVRRRRQAFARTSGRTSSMAAPVVPATLARPVPAASSSVFEAGVPVNGPSRRRPPVTVNRARSSSTNGRYSSTAVCRSTSAAAPAPKRARSASAVQAAQNAATLP